LGAGSLEELSLLGKGSLLHLKGKLESWLEAGGTERKMSVQVREAQARLETGLRKQDEKETMWRKRRKLLNEILM
jgi:hypothetical protein